MTHKTLHLAIAAALFATLAVAGCKKREPAETAGAPAVSATATMPAPAEPMPAATTAMPSAATMLTVTTVDLGNAIGADNRISMPMTSFAKADTIHASVASDGPGGNLTGKWTMGDKVVDTQSRTVAAGPQVTEFSISKPDGWPVGHYKLEVSSDGNPLQTREFDIK